MDPNTQRLFEAAAGAAGGEGLGIEDVFSTWLYTGNGSTQTITNGIDLAGEGGLVWLKRREAADPSQIYDTERGVNKLLRTTTTAAEVTAFSDLLTSFNSDGFSLGADSGGFGTNPSGGSMASWTFRKAENFFDVVTYTGTGVARTVAHNLGSVPGCILIKRLDAAADWPVYHRSLANTDFLELNQTQAKLTNSAYWNSTTPTSTVFSLGDHPDVNTNGSTYVAYLFAHDAGGFGDDGTESVIKCGSYTTDGSGNGTVNLGWEPQWILVKRSSGTGNWLLFDSMRGIPTGGNDAVLKANTSDAETASFDECNLTATGFQVALQSASSTYIYIAIRRGPMKTPTDATEVFGVTASANEPISTPITSQSGVLADLILHRVNRFSNASYFWSSRLQGNGSYMTTTQTAAEGSVSNFWQFDNNEYAYIPASGYFNNTSSRAYVAQSFRRAPGFFDVVAYTGTGSARTVSHNLGVVPELIIVKSRSNTGSWEGYHVASGATKTIRLNSDGAEIDVTGVWNDTEPTASAFTVGTSSNANGPGYTLIAYLFATCPGVSKCFNFTGTGATLQIDCGFASGARFVMIKRTDSTGGWYVWDSARGIISGNDPYLLLNSNAAEVTGTDYIDPYSAGFEISSSAPAEINASGGSYIGLAIA